MNILGWFIQEELEQEEETEISVSSDSKLYYYKKDSHVNKTKKPNNIPRK